MKDKTVMFLPSEGTYTTHIPVMVKTGRLTGRIIHRDMMTATDLLCKRSKTSKLQLFFIIYINTLKTG